MSSDDEGGPPGGDGGRAKRLRVEEQYKVTFGSDRAQVLNELAYDVVIARYGVPSADDKVRVDPHTPLAIPFSSSSHGCCVVAVVKHNKGVLAEVTGQLLVDASVNYLAPLVTLQPGRGALAREAGMARPSGSAVGARASAPAGAIPRAGLRARDDGSFVLEVTKGGRRFLVAVKDSEVRGGQLLRIVGEETGAYAGSYREASSLFTDLALNLRRDDLEPPDGGAARRPMAFVESGGSYVIPPIVTGYDSGLPMLFTGGTVLDQLLDPSPTALGFVVFRRDSCPTGPDGEPIVRPFMFHLCLPPDLPRADRLSLSLVRTQACVDALALGFAHLPTAAVVKFLAAVARVLLHDQLIELFGGAAVQVVASAYRACYKSVYLSLLLAAAGASSVEHVVSGTESTLPIILEKGNQFGGSVAAVDDIMPTRHIPDKDINALAMAAFDGRPNATLTSNRTFQATLFLTTNSATLWQGADAACSERIDVFLADPPTEPAVAAACAAAQQKVIELAQDSRTSLVLYKLAEAVSGFGADVVSIRARSVALQAEVSLQTGIERKHLGRLCDNGAINEWIANACVTAGVVHPCLAPPLVAAATVGQLSAHAQRIHATGGRPAAAASRRPDATGATAGVRGAARVVEPLIEGEPIVNLLRGIRSLLNGDLRAATSVGGDGDGLVLAGAADDARAASSVDEVALDELEHVLSQPLGGSQASPPPQLVAAAAAAAAADAGAAPDAESLPAAQVLVSDEDLPPCDFRVPVRHNFDKKPGTRDYLAMSLSAVYGRLVKLGVVLPPMPLITKCAKAVPAPAGDAEPYCAVIQFGKFMDEESHKLCGRKLALMIRLDWIPEAEGLRAFYLSLYDGCLSLESADDTA